MKPFILILNFFSGLLFYCVMMTFTSQTWGWPWWINIPVFAIVYPLISCIPFFDMGVLLCTLIYTIIQLFSSHHGDMFGVCAIFTFVFALRLVLIFIEARKEL